MADLLFMGRAVSPFFRCRFNSAGAAEMGALPLPTCRPGSDARAGQHQGKHKTRLTPDPDRAATVPMIVDLRVNGRLSYPAIAGTLNQDLQAWPPPVDPARAVGHWTPGAVREI